MCVRVLLQSTGILHAKRIVEAAKERNANQIQDSDFEQPNFGEVTVGF